MVRMSLACGGVVTAFLLACGPASDSREAHAFRAPEKVDACALFPPEEAQAVAGAPIAPVSSTLDNAVGRDLKSCAYNAGSIEVPRMVGLEVRPAKTVREAERRQAASRSYLKTLAKGQIQDVQGVGDAGFWAGGPVGQLHVRKGTVDLVVTVQAGKDPLGAAKQVAERAFARMQAQKPSPH